MLTWSRLFASNSFAFRGLRALGCAALPAISLASFAAPAGAADHGDAPLVSQDQGADIGDVYFFLDPSDNTKAILAMDVHGFIVPGEAENFGAFDPTVRFRFQIENTGDATPDMLIDVTFSPLTSKTLPQTATIHVSPTGQVFQAPTTVSSNTLKVAPNQVVTTDSATGIKFFAGLTDDPFFFDIPAFQRFVDSVGAGAPNPRVFGRGRDSFAGYNIDMVAMEVPLSLIRGAGNNTKIGVNGLTQRRKVTTILAATRPFDASHNGTRNSGSEIEMGHFKTLDRMATPAFNITFIPFSDKDAFNKATTEEDASGMFLADVLATCRKFGVDAASTKIITDLGVTTGDFLRLDTTKQNTGAGGGDNAGAGLPNGRRPKDDVVDTLLTVINNRQTLGDGVDANDVPLQDTFPFFAKPHQPQPKGTIDDSTRN